MLPEQVLALWWRLVPFMKAMNLLHRAMRAVEYWRTATAIKMASKVGACCIVALFIVALVDAWAIQSK